ncbi:TetR/AcrR family transcriptional regulator [Subtercola vilae]|uniref:TetR family transcriptional regulator n=1 Tax=Subtercola vilae TaxID=2056433 RepID=A0A4T2C834_9MICO|nr:TetR/AcrR family transcriptional regulator [Subtercola vilae]TIH40340.1 TetR family transcriptional regulator [Subtercola vilae]
MSRWQPDARERLERAALELFADQGFGETTVPQITARAGLTTRTFFRHFADKKEVLFANEIDVPALAAQMIAAAPAELTPMQIISGGLEAVAAAQFSSGVDYVVARKAVIESDEGLRERELHKQSALASAIAQSFVARGVDELEATLTAHLTVTVFSVSIGRWLDQNGAVPLPELLHETLAALRGIMVDASWSS